MNVLLGLLLIILGVMAVKDYLIQRYAAFKNFYVKIAPYEQFIGFAGILVGFFWLLEAGYLLIHVSRHPLLAVAIWILSPLMMALGLIFGLDLLRRIIIEADRPSSFMVKVIHWRDIACVYHNELGLFAIVAGSILIFV